MILLESLLGIVLNS